VPFHFLQPSLEDSIAFRSFGFYGIHALHVLVLGLLLGTLTAFDMSHNHFGTLLEYTTVVLRGRDSRFHHLRHSGLKGRPFNSEARVVFNLGKLYFLSSQSSFINFSE